MSPTGYRPGRAVTAWRAAIVGVMLVVALLTIAVVALFNSNRDAIDRGREAIHANRDLGCRIGGFLVGVPIVKQPGITQAQFQRQVAKALAFLHALRRLDCKGLGGVTTAKIEKQQKALRAIQRGGGSSTGNPHQPGSPSGGGLTPAPPSPSTSPAPPPATTPAPPPTTTTTSPQPSPPPGGIVRRVCHTNPLGQMVCELIRGL